MEIAHGHTWDEGVEPVDLWAAVVTYVSVPLVDDIVVLGVEPSGTLGVSTEGVDHLMVVPGDVDVASRQYSSSLSSQAVPGK